MITNIIGPNTLTKVMYVFFLSLSSHFPFLAILFFMIMHTMISQHRCYKLLLCSLLCTRPKLNRPILALIVKANKQATQY